MAKRPIFKCNLSSPFYETIDVEFKYYNGFADSQVKKSIDSLHSEYLKLFPTSNLIEISSKSSEELGVSLSAFNLMICSKNKQFSVESAFQSSKVFENGGPYIDLLYKSSKEAKKDPRLRNSGTLKHFVYYKRTFELLPLTYFYDWLYVNALNQNPILANDILKYDSFSDILFNPEKSINCQARSAAIFVSLFKSGLLKNALQDHISFKNIVYGEELADNMQKRSQRTDEYYSEQLSFFRKENTK